jgi:phage terminase large subunit-like protein
MIKSLSSKTIKIPKPHKGGQRAILVHPAKYQVVACGRRFGKTEAGKIIAFMNAVNDGKIVWWVTPTYKMSTPVWKTLLEMLRPVASWISAQERRIYLPNGGEVAVWAGESPDSIRGGKADVVIIDEAAMLSSDEAWYKVLKPALMDREGRAYFFSTPRGHNWFYELFLEGLNEEQDLYKSWQFSSYYNPFIKKSIIDENRKSTPDRFFRQEYLAEFIDDAGEVFRRITEVSILPYSKPYEGNFVMGIDWGRKLDFTAISVIDTDTMRQVDLARFSKIAWEIQRNRVLAMINKWKPKSVIAEENSLGDVLIEQFQTEFDVHLEPYYMTNKTKALVIDKLVLNIETEKLKLLKEPVQIRELQGFSAKRSSFGNIIYNAPAGMHDDTVIALALANYAATESVSSFGGALPRLPVWR